MASKLVDQYGAKVIGTEAGHVTLPGTCRREDAVIELLRERFGHVSVERVLSGEGLSNLHHSLATIYGLSLSERDAAEIVKAALDDSCPTSRAALAKQVFGP